MIQLEITCYHCKATLSYVLADQAMPLRCSGCNTVVGKATPTSGYLYALRNNSMPGLLKVGFTTRSVQERVAELNSSTATPSPFNVVFFFACTQPQKDEALCHTALATYRLNEAREFFRIPETDALLMLRKTLSRTEVFLDTPQEIRREIEADPFGDPEFFRKGWRRKS